MEAVAPHSAEIPLHLGPGETGAEVASPALLADAVAFLREGYRVHGPIFRVKHRGQDCVVIAGQAANELFWQNPENWSYGAARKGFTSQLGPMHVTQLDGAQHSRKRRLLKAGFSMEAVARHVPEMALAARDFVSEWPESPSELMGFLMRMLLTLNARTLLKAELTKEEVESMLRFEEDLMYGMNYSLDPSAHFSGEGYSGDKRVVFAVLDRLLGARLEGERSGDNLDALLDQDPGAFEKLSPAELRADCYLLLLAGVENTAKLIARALERLSVNDEWRERVRTELKGYTPQTFARGLGSVPSLRAVIQETERLHPGLIFTSRAAASDIPFAGKTIPAGRMVLQAHTLVHFIEENYPEPMRFDPSRWLQAEPSRKNHVLFGGGVHVCLGMNVARLQMPIVLAELLLHREVRLDYVPAFGYAIDAGRGRRPHGLSFRLVARP